ncbi:glycoside hydrolase family 3 C-terminal domain-containing protein [Jonesia quinghaiensis]|uniref:glycoside hydrolase family 3 C-terminal domain-containing protein n=1 Tax=Jonesia quinghaiensis TaxID=262806 RepID=UPI0004238B14|nr:glycoside hydrolase family 3 C-terminal domain-containing protein [Jonesia quinghaiensis]
MESTPVKDASGRKPMSNKKFLGIWVPVLALLTVILVVANVALNIGSNWVASQLGTGTYTVNSSEEAEGWDTDYYTSEYDSIEAVDAAAKEVVQEIAGEGIVLAKHEGNALPLASGAKVTMLGRAAADPVYGGSGSGSVDTSQAVDARQGLINAGFEVNETVFEEISAFAGENPRGHIEMDLPDQSSYNIGELPVGNYEEQAGTFSDYNDAALIYLGRPGGEGGDLATDLKDWDDNYTQGQHQLELNKDELDLIDLATENFDTVIVLVNSSTSMELGPVQDNADVDSVLLIGSPGATGFNAVGEVLTGDINPSGRTVDLWATDFTADPTFVNFGNFLYSNLEVSYPASTLEAVASNATVTDEAPFVNYQEGIYFGYRYYETAAAEGFINYDDAVVYPFGYGLSYTDFEWNVTNSELGAVDGSIAVDVEVTNTGDVAGKDVVELFYTAPYTEGGIEKAEVVLGGFQKTGLIEPGQSETVTITLMVEDMASYDYEGNRAYVLEAGDYVLSLRTDSHNVAQGVEPITYTVDETVVYSGDNTRSTDQVEVTNQFDDVSAMFTDSDEQGKIRNMSRADFAGTFPTAPSDDMLIANDDVAAGFAAYDAQAAAEASDVEMPTTGKDSDLTLIDMRGLERDDPQWGELLDSLSVDDMTNMLLNGAYQTGAIVSIAKPMTTDLDGPAGFSSFINASVNGVAYPSEYLIAQTWNPDMARAMGDMLGNEALFKEVSGWYAPAMNLHRSPFAGRNFEYYSEDPFLSGVLATAASNGAAQKGLYTTLKHYALNDQEANRVNNGIATWANEQTIREIYLKPFEMAVKNIEMPVPYIADDNGTIEETTVGATAVMSSFNRIGSVWAGGSEALMDTVLRDEWGFEGFAISDFNLYRYMNPNQGIAAGTDLTLTFAPSKSFDDTSSAFAVSNIRNATHNILYTVANSNAMNGFAPGATVTYTPPTWRYIQIGASIGLGLLIVAGAVLVFRRVRKHSAAQPAVTVTSD